jgi:hypothetical protein
VGACDTPGRLRQGLRLAAIALAVGAGRTRLPDHPAHHIAAAQGPDPPRSPGEHAHNLGRRTAGPPQHKTRRGVVTTVRRGTAAYELGADMERTVIGGSWDRLSAPLPRRRLGIRLEVNVPLKARLDTRFERKQIKKAQAKAW